MTEREFDVVVIGMRPGGEFVATKLAGAGVPVAAVEQRLVGGECHFWGCIPSKMMIRAGNLLAEGRRIPGMAGASVISPDWAPVARRISGATHGWTDKPAADRFTGLGETLCLGAGAIGQDEHASYLEVDENMRAAPGVWALGDVVGKGAHTHMALYHGRIILSLLLGRPYHPAEYHAVPEVTFTDPEIGAVGLTEAQARERLGDKVRTAVRRIPDSDRGWIHKAGNDGFIKLVVDGERGVLVGAASAGPDGGEVLSMLTLAVYAAVPVQRLREMIYAFPTFHGAVPEAIGRLS